MKEKGDNCLGIMRRLEHSIVELSGMNLIEASAGTGKTYAVASLYLRLLVEKKLRPEQILVVTYTEAATKELRARIRSRIREAIEVMEGAETKDAFLISFYDKSRITGITAVKEILERALGDFDTASIYTIHGFCLRALQKLGSIMGSGGMIVMDEDDCMVDIAKFYLGFCVDESCGKCVPCRIGGYQMLSVLGGISEGQGKPEDIDKLKRIALAMQKASLCALGQTAANPVVSTLKYFSQEYDDHIINRKCRSHKCKHLLNYSIKQEKCKRCRVCVINCPVNAISGDKEKGFFIDPKVCVRCGKCFDVCKFNAIAKE